MVPSVGFPTAEYALVFAFSIQIAHSLTPNDCLSPTPSDMPLKNCDNITPLLPLASISDDLAIKRDITSNSSDPEFNDFFMAFDTAFIVIAILVPVSPSGTGNTLRLFTSSI